MAKGKQYSREWFQSKGYVEDEKGVFHPPPLKSEYIKSLKERAKTAPKEIIIKEQVIKTSDFTVEPVTEWWIPYQVPSKKNSQQLYIRKYGNKSVPGTTTSKRYKEYITATKKYWEVFGIEFKQSVRKLNLSNPLHVEFTFVRSTQQEVDYVGPLESVQDIMQDFGWILGDDYKRLKPYLGDIRVEKGSPGVRIKLLTNK